MKKATNIFFCSCIAALLTACSSHKQIADVGYISTKSLQNEAESAGIGQIRVLGLRQTASSLGTQGGLAWRAVHIDRALKKQATYLDHVFNFNQLMLPHNVLPAVLSSADKSLNLASDDTLRLADRTYSIVMPARFVTTPPTWRDYLWLQYKKPSVPTATLLPKNKAEIKLWNHYLRQGWKLGLEQANEIFAADLARLKRDMSGMILYRKLLAEHMVTAPFVSKADLGITGNSSSLRINDQVLRITAQSKLQTDVQQWRPVITKRK